MSMTAIIIPTFNNFEYLAPCIQSIIRYTVPEDLFHIYLVNNGEPESVEPFKGNPYITILQQEKNLGWEGGLKAGLAASKEPYVVFMNDDTFVPSHQRFWLHMLLNEFVYPECAAVGPSSNVVMGSQNIFGIRPETTLKVKFLIGFCMLVKRDYLELAGGIDNELPGGDDLDLSIRLRKLGKYLIAHQGVFVYHHGFKTGERVEGGPAQGGWNSIEKIERTNNALIRKHGLRAFLDLWTDVPSDVKGVPPNWGDPEAEICKRYTVGENIAELGCGDKKLFSNSVGFDITPKGEEIPGLSRRRYSLADIAANVAQELPVPAESFDTIIAQHVLEHICDTVGAIGAWKNALKHGGRLIIAVPDHTYRNTIPLNHEHVRGFTPESLRKEMELMGFNTVDMLDSKNDVSFVGVFERNGL